MNVGKVIDPQFFKRQGLLLIFLSTLIFLMPACQSPLRQPASGKEHPFHLVLDIDWTIVSPLSEEQAKPFSKSPHLIHIEGESYLIKPGTLELIKFALEDPFIELSFFSGGRTSRNHSLVNKLLQMAQPESGKVFKILSREDLTPVAFGKEAENLRFSERLKKDLRKIDPELKNIVLVEDIPHFAHEEGLNKTLWLGKTTFPTLPGKNFEESQNFWRLLSIEERFVAQSPGEDWWAKRKLFWLLSALEQGIREDDTLLALAEKAKFRDITTEAYHTQALIKSVGYRRFLRNLGCPALPF